MDRPINPNAESNGALMLAAVRQIMTRVTAVEDQILVLSTELEQHGVTCEQLRVAIEMLRQDVVALKAAIPHG